MNKRSPEKLLSPSEENIRRILAEYSISLDRFELAANGIENLTVIVWSGNRKYVLRIYPQQTKSDNEIKLEIDFMDVLREQGLPVPEIIPSLRTDELTITEIDGLRWQSILMKFAPGLHPAGYTPALINSMAETQATMHKLGIQYAQSRNLANVQRYLQETLVADRLLRDKSVDSYYQKFLRRAQAYKVELSSNLPVGVSHFDYDIDNLFAQNDQVTAVLDFGDIACMPLTVCLGYTLWDVLFEENGSTELASLYVQRYEALRQLSDEEKAILNQIILFRHYVITTLRISFGNFSHGDLDKAIKQEEYLNNLTIAF